MRTAQEQALLVLACGRGLISPGDRARLEATGPSEVHLAQRLLHERLLAPEALAGLVRELSGGAWRCPACPDVRFGWPELFSLPRLVCPRCQGPLTSQTAGASASGLHRSATRAPSSRRESQVQPLNDPEAETRNGTQGARASGRGPVVAGQLPRRLGPYTLLSQLGQGSCAKVFLARRDDVAREFALKVVEDPGPEDEEVLARFRREIEVASRIRHPGVVPIVHAGSEGGSHYYAMEYCPGITLKERLRASGPLSPQEAAALVAQLARAAGAAHAAGVIHRDLKPANIMLEEGSGTPRITDFGMARDEQTRRSLTATGDVLGTPYYMAPEQFRGERDLDARVDVYALGVILYEVLSGRRPFEAPTALALKRRIERGDPTPLSELCPELPPALEEVCRRAMAVDKAERPESAEELAEELEALVRARSEAGGGRALLFVGVALGVLVGAVGAGGGVLLLTRPAPASQPPPPLATPDQQERAEKVQHWLQEASDLAGRHGREQARPPWPDVEAALGAAELASGKERELRAQVALTRAELERRRGSWLDALRRAEVLGSAEALLVCAQAQEKLGQRSEASKLWAQLAEGDPQRAATLAAGAARARLEGAMQTARERAEQATKLGPQELAGWRELARACLALQRPDDAVPAIDRYELLAPDDPELGLLRARQYLLRGTLDGAKAQLERAGALLQEGVVDPDLLALQGRLAVERALQGGVEHLSDQLKDARQALDAALAVNPRHGESLVHKALLLLLDSLMEENTESQLLLAKQAWTAAGEEMGRSPRLALTNEHWGDLLPYLRSLEQPEWGRGGQAARTWIEETAARVPGPARESFRKALQGGVTGVIWSTIAGSCSAALAVAPQDPVLRREAARLCLGRGKGREALIHLDATPQDPERERMRAEALWMAGLPGQAAEVFARVATDDARGVEGCCAAAEAAWLDRREADALRLIDQALLIAPGHYTSLILRALFLYTLRHQDAEVMAMVEAAHDVRGFLDVRLLLVGRRMDEFRPQFGPGAPPGGPGFERRGPRGWPGRFRRPPPMGEQEGQLLKDAFERVASPNSWFLGRDMHFRRRDEISLREPDPGWELDAYFQLVSGRLMLLDGSASQADVRKAWRRARELDPKLRFSEADGVDLAKRFPQASDLERFLVQ